MLFGLDLSHHQDLSLDLARCKREGISFVFLKATEGSSFVDNEFAANVAEARRAGLLVAAYHYVRGNVPAAAQRNHIASVVPQDVPIIPDTEQGGGMLPLTRDLISRLRGTGYRVPLIYLPRWYWQQIGSPSLAGLPPLWASRYPDMVQGTLADEWDDVPAHYWQGHGGLPVVVLQFTSSARIAGHAPIDANAYRGTRAQLAALLGGEEDDMTPEQDRMLRELHALYRKGNHTPGHPQTAGEYTLLIVEMLLRGRRTEPLLTALAADQNIDPAELAGMVIAAQREFLEELVREVVPKEQADLIVDALVARLTNEGN